MHILRCGLQFNHSISFLLHFVLHSFYQLDKCLHYVLYALNFSLASWDANVKEKRRSILLIAPHPFQLYLPFCHRITLLYTIPIIIIIYSSDQLLTCEICVQVFFLSFLNFYKRTGIFFCFY